MKLIAVIVLALFFAYTQPAHADTFNYPLQNFSVDNGNKIFASPWGPAAKFDTDAAITTINFSVVGMPNGSAYDFCVYLKRVGDPQLDLRIAAGSEMLCATARRVNLTNWSGSYNLTSTPLYIPKGTEVFCEVTAYNVSNNSGLANDCSLTYHPYVSGEPRFRSLRFPYVDQPVLPNGDIPFTIYNSHPTFPLKAKGFAFFQSFFLNTNTATATDICLTHLRQGGSLVDKVCAPNQVLTANPDYSSPTQVFPANLVMPTDSVDILSATCHNSQKDADCAIWAFVEIPPSLPDNGDSIVANYNMVPPPWLLDYCTANVSHFWHPFFCDNANSCTLDTKIATCTNKLFPTATAVSPSTTPTPGDLTGDGRVTLADYNKLLQFFGNPYTIFGYNSLVANFEN